MITVSIKTAAQYAALTPEQQAAANAARQQYTGQVADINSGGYFSGQHGSMFHRGAAAMNEVTGGSRFRPGMIDGTLDCSLLGVLLAPSE